MYRQHHSTSLTIDRRENVSPELTTIFRTRLASHPVYGGKVFIKRVEILGRQILFKYDTASAYAADFSHDFVFQVLNSNLIEEFSPIFETYCKLNKLEDYDFRGTYDDDCEPYFSDLDYKGGLETTLMKKLKKSDRDYLRFLEEKEDRFNEDLDFQTPFIKEYKGDPIIDTWRPVKRAKPLDTRKFVPDIECYSSGLVTELPEPYVPECICCGEKLNCSDVAVCTGCKLYIDRRVI
jgi:hypothetical protein